MRGTSVPFVMAVLCLCTPTVGLAQSPDVGAIRKQAQGGQYETAWTSLQRAPETAELLRTAIEISLPAGRVDRALASYERLLSLTGQPDPAALADISRAVLQRDRRDQMPLARVESCRALFRMGDAECKADLELAANDARMAPRVRLTAAAALAEKDRAGVLLLQRVGDSITGYNKPLVAEAASRLPASAAVPLLTRLLASPVPDAQVVAATLLGDFDTPAARSALKAVVATEGSAARPAARIALAKLGDPEQLRLMGGVVERLEGADRYRVGSALAAAGDPRGLQLLERALSDDDPIVRIDAAAAIAPRLPAKAYPVIEEALRTGDLNARAHALEVVASLGWAPSTEMWKLLKDANAVVRVRAAEICARAGRRPAPKA